MTEANETPRYTLYGRRKGRRLRGHKADLMESLLPQLRLADEGPVNPATLFPDKKEIWLEIGFGGGEHMAHQATENLHAGIIGCEPFVNGIASALDHIAARGLTNIRLFPNDARALLDRLPPACLSRCFLLFPDPWPKKRHADRRFIGEKTLLQLERVLKPGAELRLASDDPTMQLWFTEHLEASGSFTPMAGTQRGAWAEKPTDWITTRYEEKNLAKKRPGWTGPRYYSFVKC